MRALTFLLLFCLQVSGASYWVATTGNDSAAGSEAAPWRTIQKAASTAVAGDTVTVKAGEYNEYVECLRDGGAGNLITFQGERGAGGEWLTILDPSTAITNGWTAAPEIGSGVYKYSPTPFEVDELSISHKRVAFVYSTDDIQGAIDNAYSASGLTTGAQILNLASNTTLTSTLDSKTITFWNGVEALWGTTNSTTLYLRLRDGSNPNGLNIRIAKNKTGAVSTDMLWPAVTLDDRSYLVWKNFLIRGAFGCMRLLGTSAHHITIQSNYLANGYSRILLGSGAHDNTILNNEITTDYYGYTDPGAWGGNGSATRENLYLVAKFLMGVSSSFDDAVKLQYSGLNNIVASNHIYKTLGSGINILSGTNTTINANTIEGHPSVGIVLSEDQVNTRIYDNLISDSNTNLRYQHMDAAGEVERLVYVYRNRLWLPAGTGDHIFTHFYGTPTAYYPVFWTYHNSFSGGYRGLSVGIELAHYSDESLAKCYFVNNIFNAPDSWIGNIGAGFWTNAMVGAFDYNELTPPLLDYPSTNAPSWAGAHNKTASVAEWSTNSVPTFILRSTSPAIDNALDVTQTFSLSGTNYSALPATSATKVGSAWDMGALEYMYAPIHIQTFRVRSMKGK